jgi:hypothetical protein
MDMSMDNGMNDVSILMVDIDEATLPLDKERYEREVRKIVEFFGHEVVGITYKLSTHKGIHIYVWVKPEVEPMRIPLFQYLLGSDFKRECINFFRYIKGIDINVLFAGKKKVDKHAGINMDCYSMCRGLIKEIRIAEAMGLKRIEV